MGGEYSQEGKKQKYENKQNEQSQIDRASQQRQQSETFQIQNNIRKICLKKSTNASKNLFNYPVSPLKQIKKLDETKKKASRISLQLLKDDYLSNFEQMHSLVSKKRESLTEIEMPLQKNMAACLQIRQQNVFDFYHMRKCLGKDKYKHKQTYIVRCRDKTQERRCLKAIPKVYFREKELIKGQNEIHNLIKVSHENVIQLIEVFEDINTYYLIFQYIEGSQNLIQFFSTSRENNQAQCKTIIKQLLSGLNYIHSKGIVHRDIRVENIIVYQDNSGIHIKIINFGLSLDLNKSGIEKRSFGTQFYAPPESNEGIINHKYDIWSVGILIIVIFSFYKKDVVTNKLRLVELTQKKIRLKQHIQKLPDVIKEFALELLISKNKRRPTAEKALKLQWLTGLKRIQPKRNSMMEMRQLDFLSILNYGLQKGQK